MGRLPVTQLDLVHPDWWDHEFAHGWLTKSMGIKISKRHLMKLGSQGLIEGIRVYEERPLFSLSFNVKRRVWYFRKQALQQWAAAEKIERQAA